MEFRLTVTDTNEATASDEITVSVHPKHPEVTGIALVAEGFQSASWEVVERTSGNQVTFNRVNSNEIEFTIADSPFYDVRIISHSGLTEQTLSILTSNVPAPGPNELCTFITNNGGTVPAWFTPGSYAVNASALDYQPSAVGFTT